MMHVLSCGCWCTVTTSRWKPAAVPARSAKRFAADGMKVAMNSSAKSECQGEGLHGAEDWDGARRTRRPSVQGVLSRAPVAPGRPREGGQPAAAERHAQTTTNLLHPISVALEGVGSERLTFSAARISCKERRRQAAAKLRKQSRCM